MKSKHLLIAIFTAFCALSAKAYVPSYYTTQPKLSSGRWIKIKVTNTGIHEITYSQLMEMGFSDPSKVSVYGYGGALLENTFDSSLPDDLPVQPIYRTDTKICFYGEGATRNDLSADIYQPSLKRNPYSFAGYYFLSDSNPGESKEPTEYSLNGSATENRTTHNSIQVIEHERTSPAMAGAKFFGPNFKDDPIQEFSFVAPDADTTVTGKFSYTWASKSSYEYALSFTTNNLTIMSEQHQSITALSQNSDYYYNYKDNNYISVKMKDGADSIYSFTASIPSKVSILQFAAIDYATFIYKRHNNVKNRAQLRMIFNDVNSSTAFIISGANANTQVWNVSSPHNVCAYQTYYNAAEETLKGSFERKYVYSSTGHAHLIAFDPYQTQYQVEYVGEVPNQNIHINNSPDMLIITNKSMRSYAEELAQAHRSFQGLSVLVVDQEEVFNEYSSGTPSAMAYRRLAKMFYDLNSTKFKYLLLYGAGSYDNKGVGLNPGDNLLTYQCETVPEITDKSRSYCADSYFGMLQDSYTPAKIYFTDMDIAVSRIPADRYDYAESTNAKTIEYLKNPPLNSSRNRGLLLCDDGDANAHLIQAEKNNDTITNTAPHFTITKAYNGLYPWTEDDDAKQAREVISQALASGQFYMSFTGHGSPPTLTKENLWTKKHVQKTNYNIAPIAFLSTCDALSFDRADHGISETMLYKRNGGAIAIVAAGRTVYRDCNQVLNLAFSHSLFNAQKGDCIGDVYKNAHNNATLSARTSNDKALGINNLSYNLIGDPALPINTATHSISTTTINDITIQQDSTCYTVYPLVDNYIAGSIVTNNIIDSNFNGTITLTLYDGAIDTKIYTHDGDPVVTITRNEDILTEFTVPVTNGSFIAKINIPIPMRPGVANKLTYYAVTSDHKKIAQGIFDRIIVGNYDESQSSSDTTPPEITEMYLDSPSFSNGDGIGSETTFYATIMPDESGLCNSSGTIGTATKLILDNAISFPGIKGMLTTDINGVTTIKYPISELQDGYHSLTLSVADNIGNRTSKTISFYVINNSVQTEISVEEKPARIQATIDITHNFNSSPSGRLVIEDIEGNTIFSRENCTFPYEWNLQDSNGNKVTDGIYNCYAILNAQKQYSSTPKVKIIVVKQ